MTGTQAPSPTPQPRSERASLSSARIGLAAGLVLLIKITPALEVLFFDLGASLPTTMTIELHLSGVGALWLVPMLGVLGAAHRPILHQLAWRRCACRCRRCW